MHDVSARPRDVRRVDEQDVARAERRKELRLDVLDLLAHDLEADVLELRMLVRLDAEQLTGAVDAQRLRGELRRLATADLDHATRPEPAHDVVEHLRVARSERE